jgi:hypothetical protein
VSEFLREIEEEVRKERLLAIWRDYGLLIVGAALLLVIGVGGYQIWGHFSARSHQDATATLIAATKPLTQGDFKGAVEKLTEARKTLPGDLGALAGLREAQAQIGLKDNAAAIKTLDAIANDENVGKDYRGLANIYSAALQLDTASFDEINAKLGQLANMGETWRFSARELIGFAAIRAGKTDVARAEFQKIIDDPQAPLPDRERARSTLSAIASAESVTLAPPPAPEIAPAAPAPQEAPAAKPAAPAKGSGK